MKIIATIGNPKEPDKISIHDPFGPEGKPTIIEFGLTAGFSRSMRERSFDPYSLVNQYLDTLNWVSKKKFLDYYNACSEAFYNNHYPEDLSRVLAEITSGFFTAELVGNITNWARRRPDIALYDFSADFDMSDGKPFTMVRTYLREDYMQLVGFALATRFMFPIWTEFANLHAPRIGDSYWAYECFKLLRMSDMVNCEALSKLRNYISANLESDQSYKNILPSISADGCGTEDYIDWLLGTYVTKRLPLHDITNPELANLVVIVHNDAVGRPQMKLKGDTQFGTGIKIKDPNASTSDDADAPSSVEALRVKAEHSMGSIVAHEQYLRNYTGLAMRLLRTTEINTELLSLLNAAIHHSFGSSRIPEHTIILTKWVLRPVVHTDVIGLIKRNIVLDIIAVAQYYLFVKGHTDLALLITSMHNQSVDSLQGGGGTLDRVPPELAASICKLVPHQHISQKRNKTLPPNRGIVSVDLLAKKLIANDWILTTPRELVRNFTGRDGGTRHRTPSSIAVLLCNLVLEIGDNIKATIS